MDRISGLYRPCWGLGEELRRCVSAIAATLVVLFASAARGAPEAKADNRVDVRVEAVVAPSLESLTFGADYTVTLAEDQSELVFARVADQAAGVDPSIIPPSAEPQLFAAGFEEGGFRRLRIVVDGQPCRPRPVAGAWPVPLVACRGTFRAGQPIKARIEGVVDIPDRFGPFGRRKQQVTLLGGWFPTVGLPGQPAFSGTVRARVSVPPEHAAVVGRTYSAYPPAPAPEPRWVEGTVENPTIPLIVLPARTGTRPAGRGRIRWISGRRFTDDSTALRQAELTVDTLEEVLATLADESLPLPSADEPLLVVEAPLRRNLARAGPGVVLVSDRAFRLLPFERFFRFHRYPIVREVTTAWAHGQVRRDRFRHVSADAVGAYLRDRFIARTAGYAEDLFDVLLFWSFIPAVDSILYAPQTAFIEAYFRVADETDPLRVNLVDPPSPWPRGRLIYEKLLDRAGPRATPAAMNRLALGASLEETLDATLGSGQTGPFLETWLGPYPKLQYRLETWRSEPIEGSLCAPAAQCHLVSVDVSRSGAAVVEPVQLRLTDDDGAERFVWTETSSRAVRTVTATLAASLDLVELDPWDRIAETPTVDIPSPKFDNRSHPRWRVLVNSFNLQLSPTAGTLDSDLNLAVSRVRDVYWRFGISAGFSPQALSLSGRAIRRFGHRVTPDRLAHWVGGSVGGQQLRDDFADAEANYALTGQLFYGYDDRLTAWAPEPGLGLRAAVTYNHVFGALSTVDSDGVDVTRDAVAVTLRGLRSWRVDGRHQLSLRGSVGAYVAGRPQQQLLYFLGGRDAVRGYLVDEEVGRYRAITSAEWVHTLLTDADENVVELSWATKLDGALFADVAAISDELEGDFRRKLRADVGYGLRIYLDYFGVRPGVMSVDLAFPLLDQEGRFEVGTPAVYIDFSQSFFVF